MIENIATSDEVKVRELSAEVILHAEGPEIARIVVRNAIAKQSDPTKKATLEEVHKVFWARER